MLGKIPRRTTDPSEAFRRALIPGGGYAYNGYPEMAGTLPVLLIFGGLDTVMLFVSGFSDQYSEVENIPLYTGLNGAAIMTNFLFPYFVSLYDAPKSAGEEFLYPLFFGRSLPGAAA